MKKKAIERALFIFEDEAITHNNNCENAMKRYLATAATLLALGLGALSPATWADDNWPRKSVRLVVPFPAGGATDSLARVLAEFMHRELGKPVIVDNRAGAGGNIGAEVVARAPADGHMLMLTITNIVQTPQMLSRQPFDPIKDFTPIAQLVTTPLVMVVRAESGITTPAELVEHIRNDPSHASYGSYGAGSSGHLYGYAFAKQTGLDIPHVAYRGEAPSVSDLLGGQVTAVIMSGVGAAPHVRAGRMNALAMTGTYRMPALPDVPTFQELGYERMDNKGWFGLFGPAGMDPALQQRLSDLMLRALKDPEVAQRVENLSLVIDPVPASDFADVVASDYRKWGTVIREAGIRLD